MSKIDNVVKFVTTMTKKITEDLKGKPIPNWFDVEGVEGFSFHITQSDVNVIVSAGLYPVEEANEGDFLCCLQVQFVTKPIQRDGYYILPSFLSNVYTNNYALNAEDQQELQDKTLEIISNNIENAVALALE